MSPQMVTEMASVVDLGPERNASDDDVASVFHPLYREALQRAPRGRISARGLPFDLADVGEDRAWLLVDRQVRIDLGGVEATHLVMLQFCDAWHDGSGERPAGVPVGWVTPVGEPLATVRITRAREADVEFTLRRRFEVNDGIVGWGGIAFLAVPHRAEAAVDWRGPHARLPEGRFAPPGHTGPMTVLPASWATDQTGVEDHVPDANDDLTMWLHAVDVRGDAGASTLRSVEVAPMEAPGAKPSVVVAAMTTFSGSDSPLRWLPRRSLRVTPSAGSDTPVTVDLGLVARRRRLPLSSREPTIIGWGVEPQDSSDDEEVELTATADATIDIDGQRIPVRDIDSHGIALGGSRSTSIRLLPNADRRLQVRLLDASGHATAARVRVQDQEGRYFPPLGHRSEVNPGLMEDFGADVVVNGSEYAYVDGSFDIDVPGDGAVLEVAGGFHRTPLRRSIEATDLERGHMEVSFDEVIRPGAGRWVAGDTHVHFLAPSTAMLQARAEGVNVVHLLACTWGEHHTSVTDFGGDQASPDGEHAVWVGSENRQNMLGHVGLVGSQRPLLPFTSGGPPEGPIGAPVTNLMADWLQRSRDAGGLAIGAHFPLPYAEVPADIAWGLIDALEFETFDHTLEAPPITGWYRFLDAGYRLPVVGGTDKMSASVPLGQIRTWARLEEDGPVTFAAWADAVRAGRTFVSSGPLIELIVEGQQPGATLEVDRGASLDVVLSVRAAQPIISVVELVVNGTVVAAETASEPCSILSLRHRLRIEDTGWIAGRSRSPYAIGSAFATAMAAHTSPIYVDCRERPRPGADLAEPLAIIDGTQAWLEQLAPIRDADDLERFRAFLEEGRQRLRRRQH